MWTLKCFQKNSKKKNFWHQKHEKNTLKRCSYLAPKIFYVLTLLPKTAQKQKFHTTKGPLMQDWVFRLGFTQSNCTPKQKNDHKILQHRLLYNVWHWKYVKKMRNKKTAVERPAVKYLKYDALLLTNCSCIITNMVVRLWGVIFWCAIKVNALPFYV